MPVQSRARSLEQAAAQAVTGVARAHHGRDERTWRQRARACLQGQIARAGIGRAACAARALRAGWGLQQPLCDAFYLRSRRYFMCDQLRKADTRAPFVFSRGLVTPAWTTPAFGYLIIPHDNNSKSLAFRALFGTLTG